MKKLLLTLLSIAPLLFTACGDDDNKDGDGLEIQDYTSFVIENEYSEIVDFFYVKVAYKDTDGTWKTIADVGHLQDNKPSKEVKLTTFHQEVRLFCRFRPDSDIVRRYDFEIKENRKNILKLEDTTQWQLVDDITDPKQHPLD